MGLHAEQKSVVGREYSFSITDKATTVRYTVFNTTPPQSYISLVAECQCSDSSLMASLEDGHRLQASGVPYTHKWLLANLSRSNKVLVRMEGQAGENEILRRSILKSSRRINKPLLSKFSNAYRPPQCSLFVI